MTVRMSKVATLKVQLIKPASKRVDVYLQRKGANTMQALRAEPNDDSVVFEKLTPDIYKLSINSNDFMLNNGSWEQDVGPVRAGVAKTVTLELKRRQ